MSPHHQIPTRQQQRRRSDPPAINGAQSHPKPAELVNQHAHDQLPDDDEGNGGGRAEAGQGMGQGEVKDQAKHP